MNYFTMLTDHTHVSSIPIDVARAAKYSERSERVVSLVESSGVEVTTLYHIYKVRDSGAVMVADDESGAFALPIGRVWPVVEDLCTDTDVYVDYVDSAYARRPEVHYSGDRDE